MQQSASMFSNGNNRNSATSLSFPLASPENSHSLVPNMANGAKQPSSITFQSPLLRPLGYNNPVPPIMSLSSVGSTQSLGGNKMATSYGEEAPPHSGRMQRPLSPTSNPANLTMHHSSPLCGSWTVTDVACWVSGKLNMPTVAAALIRHKVDGDKLLKTSQLEMEQAWKIPANSARLICSQLRVLGRFELPREQSDLSSRQHNVPPSPMPSHQLFKRVKSKEVDSTLKARQVENFAKNSSRKFSPPVRKANSMPMSEPKSTWNPSQSNQQTSVAKDPNQINKSHVLGKSASCSVVNEMHDGTVGLQKSLTSCSSMRNRTTGGLLRSSLSTASRGVRSARSFTSMQQSSRLCDPENVGVSTDSYFGFLHNAVSLQGSLPLAPRLTVMKLPDEICLSSSAAIHTPHSYLGVHDSFVTAFGQNKSRNVKTKVLGTMGSSVRFHTRGDYGVDSPGIASCPEDRTFNSKSLRTIAGGKFFGAERFVTKKAEVTRSEEPSPQNYRPLHFFATKTKSLQVC